MPVDSFKAPVLTTRPSVEPGSNQEITGMIIAIVLIVVFLLLIMFTGLGVALKFRWKLQQIWTLNCVAYNVNKSKSSV